MDTLERGARMIVWLVAGALILWSVMEISAFLADYYLNHKPIKILSCIVNSIPLLIGIIFLIKAKSLTRWICDKLE